MIESPHGIRDSPPASRGCIAASATYRPLFSWDVFSCTVPPSSGKDDEVRLTDGVSYNYNCRPIPRVALLEIIARKPELASECGATAEDVDEERATGLVFVSERHNGLETLHVALRFKDKVKVVSLADIYGTDTFGGVRMEDSGCFGTSLGNNADDPSLIYISTKKMVEMRRTPWTVVYRTNLRTGKTKRLTPDGQCDLSPAVSPCGTRVAVAAFRSGRWTGETEHLKTDIVVMNVDRYAHGGGLDRKPVIQDGGWPSWGSNNVIFFHRGIGEAWGVFRYDLTTNTTERVTPMEFKAMTPAAISETKVAVATIRKRAYHYYPDVPRKEEEYRHIEIFDLATPDKPSVKITQNINPRADYYSPFVLDGGRRIGYHRATYDKIKEHGGMGKMQSALNNVGLFRAWGGAFHTISTDGSKLAFIDNEFRAVWVADKQGMRIVWQGRFANTLFSIAWNQNPSKDILYVCVGPSFHSLSPVNIYAIYNVSVGRRSPELRNLTASEGGSSNNAFPSSNPEGNKIVFRSTRDHTNRDLRHKNLYIMEDADNGEEVTRLTNGDWTDTHCQWSPRGNWIVFSSSRGSKPAPISDENDLGFGSFSIYLVMPAAPDVIVRVVTSWDPDMSADQLPGPGHANHPVFSPDGESIAFTSDLAAVSAEPVSLPMFLRAGRPYGDIFSVDIDPANINKNKDIDKINRVTHSRYEYCTQGWARFVPDDPSTQWNTLVTMDPATAIYRPACPYVHAYGGESWHATGRLLIPRSNC